MIRIAICDDEPVFLAQIKNLISDISDSKCIQYSIACFSSGKDIFRYLNSGKSFDIIFMDIGLDEISGIEVGEKLRQRFDLQDTLLIYVSAYDLRAKEVFRYNTHRFLAKPIDSQLFEEALLSAYGILKERCKKTIIIKDSKQGNVVLPIKDIYYFQVSLSHRIELYTKDAVYTIYDKISNVHSQLSLADFLLIHHSILINYDHIKNISYTEVEMNNGDVLTISGPKRKGIRKLYNEIRKKREEGIWL